MYIYIWCKIINKSQTCPNAPNPIVRWVLNQPFGWGFNSLEQHGNMLIEMHRHTLSPDILINEQNYNQRIGSLIVLGVQVSSLHDSFIVFATNVNRDL